MNNIIAVTGHTGRLGSQLVGLGCIPINADITCPKVLQSEIEGIEPDTIIHCAAITDVDKCENVLATKARKVNIVGTHILRTCFSGRIIYMSTDYVFDGRGGPYKENSNPNPISHYGTTKFMGEQIIRDHKYAKDIIVRTTILYGGNKPDFVTGILGKFKDGYVFEVTKALSGSPTYVPHLADALIELCHLDWTPSVINIAGSNVLSRYEFALMIANIFGYDPRLILPTMEIKGAAPRPRNAGLKVDLAQKIGLPIYSVMDGLTEMKERMK
jgi:dTDP-4-dehydrorhamnose reductase